MNTFGIGLLFATGENMVDTMARHSRQPSWRRFLEDIVFSVPTFVAFAFVAGIAAEWLGDIKVNHAQQMLFACGVWIGCVCTRHAVLYRLFGLNTLWARANDSVWRRISLAVLVSSYVLAFSLYLVWWQTTGISLLVIDIVGVIVGILYIWSTLLYFSWRRKWIIEDCRREVADIIDIYCRTTPENVRYISQHPGSHEGQHAQYYTDKFFIARAQKRAYDLCLCLEDELLERLRVKHSLSEDELRGIVRDTVGIKGRVIKLEYDVLCFIAGTENVHREASDLLAKAGMEEHKVVFEKMRKVIEKDGRFILPDRDFSH